MDNKKSKLAEIKTKPTAVIVMEFIQALPSEQKREGIDLEVLRMMIAATLQQK